MPATKQKARKESAKRGGTKKLKQRYLPKMEPPSIPAIDSLADRYRQARDERMRLTLEETDSADLLEAAMKKHNLSAYEYDGWVVRLNRTEKIQVSKKKADKPKREGGDDGQG